MIILTSSLFDANSPIILDEDPGASSLRLANRRLTRVATLDGGAVIQDGGYTHADRDLTIVVKQPAPTVVAVLNGMLQAGGAVRASTPEGLLECRMSKIDVGPGELTLGLFVTGLLSEA